MPASSSNPKAERNNAIFKRIVGGAAAIGLVLLLGWALNNQMALASHNSADGPHGEIGKALAKLQTDVEWIRKYLEPEQK